MDKQNAVYLYDEILFGNKKEVSVVTYYSVDEPCKHCAQWKQPVREDHQLYDSIYLKCPEEENSETESRFVVARVWGKEEMGSNC